MNEGAQERVEGRDAHAARNRLGRPGFLTSSVRVFEFTLSEMLWSRRTIFMALVAGGPVVLALLIRAFASFASLDFEGRVDGSSLEVTGPAIFGLMIWAFYLRFTVPVLGVFYGTALIADEVEDKTLTYLFTRPISRGAVLFGKYLAYLVCTNLVVLPSVVLVYFIVVPMSGNIGASFPSLVVDLGLLGLGIAVYGSIFALIGAWFRHPLLTGLVFVFGWEPIGTVVPGYMKNLTVAYYLQGLVPHAMPQDGSMGMVGVVLQAFQAAPSISFNLFCLGVILVLTLLGATRIVANKEYVLEQ